MSRDSAARSIQLIDAQAALIRRCGDGNSRKGCVALAVYRNEKCVRRTQLLIKAPEGSSQQGR